MQELEPPEAPIEAIPESLPQMQAEEPKKGGFFKRLFSKKAPESMGSSNNFQDNPELIMPSMDMPPALELPPLDDINNIYDNNYSKDLNPSAKGADDDILPLIDMHIEDLKSENTDKKVSSKKSVKLDSKSGKSKGKLKKGQKTKVDGVDESSQFDWSREISDQDILIHDNNRYNQDVSMIIDQANKHIDDKGVMTNNNSLFSSHSDISPLLEPINVHDMEIPKLEPLGNISLQNMQQIPSMDERSHKEFASIALNHEKLRKRLEKNLTDNKMFKLKKPEILSLFKLYDESVEKMIEDKEMSITHKRKQIKDHENKLKAQEKSFRDMQAYIKGLDKRLKEREENLNKIISDSVESELKRRLKVEKRSLSDELKKTSSLNNDLKKKVRIIEDDRTRFEREHTKMSENERKKLNSLQALYEKKLRELDSERRQYESELKAFEEHKKTFEEKKKESLKLLAKAEAVSKELHDVAKMKAYIDEKAPAIEKELVEDRELQTAIGKAEDSLVREKANLDNMIFGKYIEKKLRSIKPEYLEKKQDWKVALHSNPLYEQISSCRKLLSQKDIEGAKSAYSDIRRAYNSLQTSRKEKEALYTAIRELYNDIQLKMVDMQMHS